MEKVPWLEKGEIAREAEALLDRWADFSGQKSTPPIPVEAIVEKYLGITLEYDDLAEILGIPDVLGATWVEEKRMIIQESLSAGEESRIGFTCGHEIGHWILHRKYLKGINHPPTIVCRVSNAKSREEWQADYFSACLIMPSKEVQKAFHRAFGPQPLIMDNEKSCFGRNQTFLLDPSLETAKGLAQRVIEAGNFSNASREAMCYRLEELGLLINRTSKSLWNYFREKPCPNGSTKKKNPSRGT